MRKHILTSILVCKHLMCKPNSVKDNTLSQYKKQTPCFFVKLGAEFIKKRLLWFNKAASLIQ